MKIKDLKLDSEVEINGFNYHYKGILPMNPDGKGTKNYLVFENNQVGNKIFEVKVQEKEIKEVNGRKVFKP